MGARVPLKDQSLVPPPDLNSDSNVHKPEGPIYRVSNFMLTMRYLHIYQEGICFFYNDNIL